MARVVFIHGLNTYGDDDLHVGPMRFGRMHERLEAALSQRGIEVVSALEFKPGSPEEQAAEIAGQDMLVGGTVPLHLLGQSTGGLVARALAAHPALKGRVSSVITFGTPHQGTEAAKFGLQFPQKFPALLPLFALFGYDPRAKVEIFRHFTPEAMSEFNDRFPPHAPEYTLLCEVTKSQAAWPLQPFYDWLHPRLADGQRPLSDGFVWSSSQKRGECLGPFALDHFGELGFFPHLSHAARRKGQEEFERLVDTVASIVSK